LGAKIEHDPAAHEALHGVLVEGRLVGEEVVAGVHVGTGVCAHAYLCDGIPVLGVGESRDDLHRRVASKEGHPHAQWVTQVDDR